MSYANSKLAFLTLDFSRHLRHTGPCLNFHILNFHMCKKFPVQQPFTHAPVHKKEINRFLSCFDRYSFYSGAYFNRVRVILQSSSLGQLAATTACNAVESSCHDSMAILDRLDVKASRLDVRFRFGRDWSVKLLSQILEMA